MATSKPAKKSDVPATVQDTANQSTLPAFLQAKQGQPARGTENAGADDLIIPRLELVQSLSPCLDKENAAYIEGAEAGQLFNNVTRELYGSEVVVIPVFFQKEYIIWKDRKKGGGFVGAFTTMAAAEAALSELKDAEDHRINDTTNWFCYLRNPNTGKLENIVVSMAVTKLKVSRQWATLVRMTEQDAFARAYVIGSVTEANKAGEKYKNLSVKVAGYPTEEEYNRAEALYLLVSKGQVQVDRGDDGNATTTGGEKDITDSEKAEY